MKVLFLEIDQERDWAVASLGPAFIGSYLRQAGHEAELLRVPPEMEFSQLIDEIRRRAPGLLGVSLTSRQWLRARDVIAAVRAVLDIPVIAGGLHATFATETILSAPGFDYACLGEGELATLELVNALERGEGAVTGLRNIRNSRETSRAIVGEVSPKPELHPPFNPIDDLPFMARDLLDELPGVVHMTTQRGCPYPCTYCAARQFSDLYGSYADFGRRRSVGNVLEELRSIRNTAKLNYVIFLDDTFTINHAWVDEFCAAYGTEFAVPFSLHARVETVSEGLLQRLADAGCAHITYGLESGSERVRREIMQRQAPNQQFREVFAWTKNAGILVTANYIIGTPGESRAEIEETLALHDELAPDDFGYFVFYPYPGTQLYHQCIELGYLPGDYYEQPASHRESILDLPLLSKDDISEYYDRFTQVRIRDALARQLVPDDDSITRRTVTDMIEADAARG